MNKQARTLNMFQKANAEAGAFMRSFDETGKVGDDKSATEFRAMAAGSTVGIHDAQIRFKRGERIVGDFGTRGRDDGNESGFTGVGETDEANIGEKFQFESQVALFARVAVLVLTRRLVPGLGKMLINAATAAALRDENTLAGRSEIGESFVRFAVVNHRADGNLQNHVRAGVAGAVRTLAVTPPVGLEFA